MPRHVRVEYPGALDHVMARGDRGEGIFMDEVAMLIGRRYAGMSLRQIGKAIGALSYPAVSDAVRRTIGRDR